MSKKKTSREDEWTPRTAEGDYFYDQEAPAQKGAKNANSVLDWFALSDHRSEGLREDMENEPWWRQQASKLLYRTAEGNKKGASLPEQMVRLAADLATVPAKAVLTPVRGAVRGFDRAFNAGATTLAHNEALNWYRVMKEAQAEKEKYHPEMPVYKKLAAKELEARINYERYAEKEMGLLAAEREGAVQSNDNPYAGSAVTRYLLTGVEELEDDPLLMLGMAGAGRAMRTHALSGLSTPLQIGARSALSGAALTGAHQVGKALDPSERRQVDSAKDIGLEFVLASLFSIPFYFMTKGARAAAAREAAAGGGGEEPPPEGFRFPTKEEVKEKIHGLFNTDLPFFRRIFGAKSPEVATEMALKNLRNMEANVNEKYFGDTAPQNRATEASNELQKAFEKASGKISGQYGLEWEPEVPIENAPVNVSEALTYVHPEISQPLSPKTFGEFAAKNPDVPQVRNTIALQESVENMRQKAVEAWRKFQATKAKLDAKLNPTDGSKPMSQEQYNKLLNQEWNRKWDGQQSLPEMLDALKREIGWTPRLPSEANRPQLLNYSDLQNTDYGRRVTGLLKGGEAFDTAPREFRSYRPPYFLDVSASPNIGAISSGEQAMLEDANPLATYLRTINNLRNGARVGTDIGPSTYVGQQTARHIGGEGLMQAQEQQLAFRRAVAEAREILTKARAKIGKLSPEEVSAYVMDNPELWRAVQVLGNEPEYADILYQMRRAVLAGEHPEQMNASFLWDKSGGIGLKEGETFYGRPTKEILNFTPEGEPIRYSPMDYWTDAEGYIYPFKTTKPLESQLTPENRQFLEETRLKSQIAQKEAELAQYQEAPVSPKEMAKSGAKSLAKAQLNGLMQGAAHGAPYWDDIDLEQAERAARAVRDNTSVQLDPELEEDSPWKEHQRLSKKRSR